MFVHETVIALGMFPWNADVLVLYPKISAIQRSLKGLELTILKVTTLLKEISPDLNDCTR